jgi:hypothetical protein
MSTPKSGRRSLNHSPFAFECRALPLGSSGQQNWIPQRVQGSGQAEVGWQVTFEELASPQEDWAGPCCCRRASEPPPELRVEVAAGWAVEPLLCWPPRLPKMENAMPEKNPMIGAATAVIKVFASLPNELPNPAQFVHALVALFSSF